MIAPKMSSRIGNVSDGNGSMHDIDMPLRFVGVKMSPELAEQMLKKLHPNYRSAKMGKVASFAADMETDRWRLTHQGIAVDENGYVVDGANRLRAVVKSGKTVEMVVCYGLPVASNIVLDTGLARTAYDASCIHGMRIPNGKYVSVARSMFSGFSIKRTAWSVQEVLDIMYTYQKGLNFSFKVLNKNLKNVTVAGVRAVVARAYYKSQSKNKVLRLAKFAEYLYSGLPESPTKEGSVVILRNWLLSDVATWTNRGKRGANPRTMIYPFTEFALHAFLNEQAITKLERPEEELFPIPTIEKYDG